MELNDIPQYKIHEEHDMEKRKGCGGMEIHVCKDCGFEIAGWHYINGAVTTITCVGKRGANHESS